MNIQVKRLYVVIGALSLLLLLSLLGNGLISRSLAAPSVSPPQGSSEAGRSEAGKSEGSGSEAGRYQLTVAGSGVQPYVLLLDTRTGRCWMATAPGDGFVEVTPQAITPQETTPPKANP